MNKKGKKCVTIAHRIMVHRQVMMLYNIVFFYWNCPQVIWSTIFHCCFIPEPHCLIGIMVELYTVRGNNNATGKDNLQSIYNNGISSVVGRLICEKIIIIAPTNWNLFHSNFFGVSVFAVLVSYSWRALYLVLASKKKKNGEKGNVWAFKRVA